MMHKSPLEYHQSPLICESIRSVIKGLEACWKRLKSVASFREKKIKTTVNIQIFIFNFISVHFIYFPHWKYSHVRCLCYWLLYEYIWIQTGLINKTFH